MSSKTFFDLLSIPFGNRSDTVNTPRYFWDNARRGKESFVIIQRTLSGEGAFSFGGRTWRVGPEHAFVAVVPEASAYFFPKDAAAPWRFDWINFYGDFGRALAEAFRHSFGPVAPLPSETPAAARFAQLVEIAEARRAADPFETSAAAYAFMMEWARQLSSPARPARPDPVETALAISAARFREPLGVKELAAAAGLTREHFTRLFSARTGRSPAHYLRQLRLEAARRMLRTPGVPLREVALRCGFPSARALRRAL